MIYHLKIKFMNWQDICRRNLNVFGIAAVVRTCTIGLWNSVCNKCRFGLQLSNFMSAEDRHWNERCIGFSSIYRLAYMVYHDQAATFNFYITSCLKHGSYFKINIFTVPHANVLVLRHVRIRSNLSYFQSTDLLLAFISQTRLQVREPVAIEKSE